MNSIEEATVAKDKTNGMVCKCDKIFLEILPTNRMWFSCIIYLFTIIRKSMVEICVLTIHWPKDRIHLLPENIWEIDHDTVILIVVHLHSHLHVIEEKVQHVLEVVVGQGIGEDLLVAVFQEEEDHLVVPEDLEAILVELVSVEDSNLEKVSVDFW